MEVGIADLGKKAGRSEHSSLPKCWLRIDCWSGRETVTVFSVLEKSFGGSRIPSLHTLQRQDFIVPQLLHIYLVSLVLTLVETLFWQFFFNITRFQNFFTKKRTVFCNWKFLKQIPPSVTSLEDDLSVLKLVGNIKMINQHVAVIKSMKFSWPQLESPCLHFSWIV